MTYEWLLKDPRWQKKRLEIFQRDSFTCTKCGDTYSPLHVHHFYYNHDLQPWEYPDHMLTTYCDLCHLKWHFITWLAKDGASLLHKSGFIPCDIEEIKIVVVNQLRGKHKIAAIQYMDDIKGLVHG